MARLRKAIAYRRIERPYTRKSKYNELSYIKGAPRCIITKFDMGNAKESFQYHVELIATEPHQIRQNAIEAARKSILRNLEKRMPKDAFHFKIMKYPHHVLRENPLATGAGADRLSKGMKLSFGKPIGLAIQVWPNDVIFRIRVNEEYLEIARNALRIGKAKLPLSYKIRVIKVE